MIQIDVVNILVYKCISKPNLLPSWYISCLKRQPWTWTPTLSLIIYSNQFTRRFHPEHPAKTKYKYAQHFHNDKQK